MKKSNAARLIFWLALIVATGFLVRVESGENRVSVPDRESWPPLQIGPVDVSDGCTPGWSAGSNLPSVGVRSVGVYFPANGKFYAVGGRSSDAGGSDFTQPFEYDPATNI